jgi:hypothetical protein
MYYIGLDVHKKTISYCTMVRCDVSAYFRPLALPIGIVGQDGDNRWDEKSRSPYLMRLKRVDNLGA